MGSVQPLEKIVDDEVQKQKVPKSKGEKRPSSTSSSALVWTRVAVAFILAMAAISYFFF